jgi:hypothetical protein
MTKITKMSIFDWFSRVTPYPQDKLSLQNSFASWVFENGIGPTSDLSANMWDALWAHYIQKVEFNDLMRKVQGK